MTGLTTHALDVVKGRGAAGLRVSLTRITPDPAELGHAVLDDHGRAVMAAALVRGLYVLTFLVAAYHRSQGVALSDPPFLDEVSVRFGVADPEAHYHVPLVLSPYSYSTYRGG